MRALGLLAPIVLLASCENEPTFDERYERAQQDIEEKAAELEGELAEDESESDGTSEGQTRPKT